MNRKIKNIIIICLIVLMSACCFLTIKYFHTNTSNATNQPAQINNNQNSNTPPEMPNNNSNNNSSTNIPPDLPDNGSSNNTDTNTPPEMPNQQKGVNEQENETSSSQNDIMFYALIIIESLIISGLIVYLILSNLNKKEFKETFNNKDKIIIYILSTVILTSALTGVSTYASNQINTSNQNEMNQNNNSNSNVTYTSATEITEDKTITEGTYDSKIAEENTISVDGDINVDLENLTVTKSGDSTSGDNSNFYGTNSAIIAKNKANLTLKNITVNTTGDGANGVFSYGGSATTNNSSTDNTTVNISDSKITTTCDNAGGIMTTGGGITNATNLTINTSGTSSAAIRTDRGGGAVTINKGTYTTTGKGSPAIYSTANVSVSNAKLIAKASEGVVIEGANSITLDNCDLTDTNNQLNGQSTTYKNIFLYQSMSGDASNGNATFKASNSNITTNKGDTLYVTNTKATIELENNTFKNNDSDGNFLRIQKDSWGTSGANGGDVTLKMVNQKATGNIVVDSISTLEASLSNNSYYEGTINNNNEAKSIKLTLDKNSKIKLTGDSYVTSLDDEDTTYSNIDFNGYKLYVNNKAIN